LSKTRFLASKQSQAIDVVAFVLALLVFAGWVWTVYCPNAGTFVGG